MHDHFITTGELGLLLAIGFGPCFILAGIFQWRTLARANVRTFKIAPYLLAALILELVLASVFWLSPLHSYFILVDGLPDLLMFVSLPIQAALLASLLVSIGICCIWRPANAV